MIRTNKKSLTVVIAISIIMTFMMIFSFGCEKKNEVEMKEIKIGAILPLSGDAASYGEMARKGIDLAVDEINISGGINNKKLLIAYEDSQGDPKLGVAAMQKLLAFQKVNAVIGDLFSSVTLAIAPIANKNKIVVLSPASSSPKITDAGDYIFRNAPSDIYEGTIMSNFAYDDLNYRNIAIVYINNEYGVGIKDVFRTNFTNKSGTIVAEESFEQGSTDFRSQLIKIKQANPEAIYLVGYKEMGYILKQAWELGIKKQFLSTVTFEDPEIITIAKNAAEGVIYSASAFDPKSEGKVIQLFVNFFKNKYNQEPDIFAGLSYDSMKIMALALADGGTTGEEIKTAMYAIKKFPGVVGDVSFDVNGDAVLTPILKTVQNGAFIPFK